MQPRHVRFDAIDLHVADFGGPAVADRTFLCVHGLGGSHANFTALAPLLARTSRVLALDLPGFGLTPPGRGSDVRHCAASIARTIDAVGEGAFEGATAPLVLVGNSMGGALAILEAARRPEVIRALVLVCPAMPQRNPLALDPRFSMLLGAAMLPGYDTFLRMQLGKAGPDAMVYQMLELCCADRKRVPREAVDAMLVLARRRMSMAWMGTSFSHAARSIVMTMLRADVFRAAMKRVRAPTLLVHGDRDRLVPVASARDALVTCPHWRLEVFDGVGHVPQLETPDRLAAAIEAFLAT